MTALTRMSSPCIIGLCVTLLCISLAAAAKGGNTDCTYTRGYWSTHHCMAGKDADSPRRISWPPVDLEDDCKNELDDFVCGLTGLEIFDMSESDGDAGVQLAKQLLAAELNKASGASTTAAIDAAIAEAYALLATVCPDLDFKDAGARADAIAVKDLLDAYNNGDAPQGPRHCGEEPCVISDWTEWTMCTAPCDGGTQERVQYVLCPEDMYPEEHAYEERPCNEEPCCVEGPWSEWSACDAVCETGTRERTRAVECHPDTPYESPPDAEVEICDTGIVCCVWSEWTVFGPCDAPCDGGMRNRTRVYECVEGHDDPMDGEVEVDPQPCNEAACCVIGEWSEWSECEGVCELGTRGRNRTVECHPDTPYEVPNATEELECDTCIPCCEWREWSEWTGCSAPCSPGGTQTRGRTEGCLPDNHDGESEEEERPCNEETPCCVFEEWSAWSNCTAPCDGGLRTRTRDVDCIGGCTRTRGYWSTHHCEAGNDENSPLRISWPPVDGQDACAVEHAHVLCGLNGLEIFDLSEAGGNMWAQLIKQWHASTLNEANGAPVPAAVAAAQDAAELILVGNNNCIDQSILAQDPEHAAAEAAKDILDAYNNGEAPGGPPHCGNGTGPAEEEEEEVCNDCDCCTTAEWTPWCACTEECGTGTRTRYQMTTCLPESGEEDEQETDMEYCNTDACCGDCCAVCDDGVCLECIEEYVLHEGECLARICLV